MFIRTTKEIITYVGRTYNEYTSEFTQAVRDLRLDDPDTPDNPDPNDVVGFEVWKLELKEYQAKIQEYANFRSGLYNLVIGRCTDALMDKLRSHVDFPAAYQNGLALLTIIKSIIFTFEETRNQADELCGLKEMFYSFKQGKSMSLQ
jgi:hypothetical protein